MIPQGTLKFTFDQNLDIEYNAGALYNHIANLPEWKYGRVSRKLFQIGKILGFKPPTFGLMKL